MVLFLISGFPLLILGAYMYDIINNELPLAWLGLPSGKNK